MKNAYDGVHFYCKVAGLHPATLLKNELLHRNFCKDFANFEGTATLKNTLERLRLIGESLENSFFFGFQF